jgi:hypothetical protein
MADSIFPHIRVAALTTLLISALEDEEAMHLGNNRLRTDLQALQARAEAQLEAVSRRLRLVDDADGSVVADD